MAAHRSQPGTRNAQGGGTSPRARPGLPPEPIAEQDAIAFILKLGGALHTAGTPSHLLEDALTPCAERLGLKAAFFSTPTSLFCGFGEGPAQRTCLLRVQPGEVSLARTVEIDSVATRVARGRLSSHAGNLELDRIGMLPPVYRRSTTIAAFALASACAAVFFSGSRGDVIVAGAIGLLVGVTAIAAGPHRRFARLVELVCGAMAAVIALLAERHAPAWLGPVSSLTATLAGVIVLLPGLSLTLAIAEVSMRHLVSGTARLTGALMALISLAFGIAVGRAMQPVIDGASPVTVGAALPPWTTYVALLLAAGGFTILFKARRRDMPIIAIASALGFLGARYGAVILGPEMGAALGAFAVGTFGNLYARLADRPAILPTWPGIMLLVPGSLGLRSLDALMQDQTVSGIDTAFRMLIVAISIVAGLLVANVAVPQRRAL